MPSFSSISSPTMPTISTSSNPTSNPATTNSGTTTNTNNSTKSIAGYGLTASTISGLSSLGGFDSLSGLLGDDSSSIYNSLLGTSSLTGSTNSAATNLLLNQILEKLNALSETINSSNNQNSTQTKATVQSATTNIVRFRINNTDLLSSINEVYISTPESDGSFFVTGDRSYYADGKTRNETFYMLFQSLSGHSQNPLGNYSVAFSVTQDYKNTNSFLYKLSQLSPLVAQKTGNLANIRLDDNSLKVDLLIQFQ